VGVCHKFNKLGPNLYRTLAVGPIDWECDTIYKSEKKEKLVLDKPQILELIGRSERAAILSLAAHGLLLQKGEVDLARVVWCFHLAAVKNATTMGKAAGVEVTCD